MVFITFGYFLHLCKSLLIFYQLFLWLKFIREVTTFKIFTFSMWQCLFTSLVYILFCLLDGEGQEKNHPYDSKYERYVYYLLFIKMFLFYLCAFCIRLNWLLYSTRIIYISVRVVMKFRHQHALLSIEAGHVTGLFQKKLFWNRSPWNIWCLNLSGRNYNMLNF